MTDEVNEIMMYLLKPETVHEISEKTGCSVEALMNLLAHDTEFGLVTKVVVVERDCPGPHLDEEPEEAEERLRRQTDSTKAMEAVDVLESMDRGYFNMMGGRVL